jgi:uncharacterized protein
MVAINVSQLLKQSAGAARHYSFEEDLPPFSDEVESVEPVRGDVDLLRTARGILASSRYRTAVRQSCGRCLEPTITELSGSSHDEFMPRTDMVTGELLEEQAESDELVIGDDHLLDLTEVIRQDLLTQLPFQPLCNQDCPGLCPECGADLRSSACSCGMASEASSPFAALAELLRRQGRDEPSRN